MMNASCKSNQIKSSLLLRCSWPSQQVGGWPGKLGKIFDDDPKRTLSKTLSAISPRDMDGAL